LQKQRLQVSPFVPDFPHSKALRHQDGYERFGKVYVVPLHEVLGALAIGHSHYGHVRDRRDGTQTGLYAGLGEATDGQTQPWLHCGPAKRLHTTQATIQQNDYTVRHLFDLAEDM
jgi:hypothetical protein